MNSLTKLLTFTGKLLICEFQKLHQVLLRAFSAAFGRNFVVGILLYG